MNIFPFHLESNLAFYLVIYVLTLVLHAIFMTYVLAGSMFLAWAAIFPGHQAVPRAQSPLAKILREWMPFVLSAAITAGVAPLLFVQIIYRREFYTSNLLLGWRWMAVVPVLIVGFYLLYVVKSKVISTWKLPFRIAVVAGVSACFLFVAFCWTTNHLLAINESRWATVYESGSVVASVGPLLLRLMTWVCGAFPCMCALAGWQLAYYAKSEPKTEADPQHKSDVKSLGKMALSGIVLSMLFAVSYTLTLPAEIRTAIVSGSGALWLLAVAIGVVLQASSWWKAMKKDRLSGSINVLVFLGAALMLIGIGFLREIVRFSHVDVAGVSENIQAAAGVGGFLLFIASAVLCIGLMTYCLQIAKNAIRDHDIPTA